MPIPTTSKWPKPKSAEEFEDIAVDFLRVRWKDPHAARNGRSGQRQNGVDVVGRPPWLNGNMAGAQCKNTDSLTLAVIIAEVDDAKTFPGGLSEYLILTTGDRDATLQADVREHFRSRPAPFQVKVVFWSDIVADIAQDEVLVAKHWKGFSSAEPALDGFHRHAQASQHEVARRTLAACRSIEGVWHQGIEQWKSLTSVAANDLHVLGETLARIREREAALPDLCAELDSLFGKGAAAPLHCLISMTSDLATGINYEITRGQVSDTTPAVIAQFRIIVGYADIASAKQRVTEVVDIVEEWAAPYLASPGARILGPQELGRRVGPLLDSIGESRRAAKKAAFTGFPADTDDIFYREGGTDQKAQVTRVTDMNTVDAAIYDGHGNIVHGVTDAPRAMTDAEMLIEGRWWPRII